MQNDIRAGDTMSVKPSKDDELVETTPEGVLIYREKNGDVYGLDNGKLLVLPDELKKKAREIRNKKKEDSIMAGEDGLVTRAELMKRDMDAMKKDLQKEIAANREVDLEIKGKVQELDKKQCVGDECRVRMETKQDEMFKIFADQLKSLAEPKFVCKNCHSASIKKGDKVCPICGDAVVVDWV